MDEQPNSTPDTIPTRKSYSTPKMKVIANSGKGYYPPIIPTPGEWADAEAFAKSIGGKKPVPGHTFDNELMWWIEPNDPEEPKQVDNLFEQKT